MKKTYYIGLDVHKDSIAIAYTSEGSRDESTYYGECGGSILAVGNNLNAYHIRMRSENLRHSNLPFHRASSFAWPGSSSILQPKSWRSTQPSFSVMIAEVS